MKKVFLLAIAGLLATGSIAFASGNPKDCKQCAKKHCTQPCPQGCPKGSCKKS